jgi:hypothetical protein
VLLSGLSAMLCPKCRLPLVLPEDTAKFDFLFMSRVECQECAPLALWRR